MRETLTAASLAIAILLGCASYEPVPLEDAPLARSQKPLGGETLAEKHRAMQRTRDDLVRHLQTLDSLQRRRDRDGLVLFESFITGYMDDHVEPLIAKDWTSRHPELAGLDASIRFVSIEILSKLKAYQRAEALIDEVKLRFRGREDLMVDYPVGKRTSLAEALELVEEQYWRG
jgi:hypothetical protein